jgi:hypothetical protein
MTKKTTKQSQQLHRVQLLKDHTHAGKLHRASSTIDVNTAEKNWLLAQHIIADDTPVPAAE